LKNRNNPMELIIQLVIFLLLLGVGLFVGRAREKKHFNMLAEKERELSSIMISDLKTIPVDWQVEKSFLVIGSTVVATDYFKTVSASLRNLFGGEMRSLGTLMERGRREAMVRMLEAAKAKGAGAVWNIRLETASITGKRKNQFGGIEVIAYGTAMKMR